MLGRVAGHVVASASSAASKFSPGRNTTPPTILSPVGPSEETVSFPGPESPTVLLFVAADCPVCGEVFDVLAQLRCTLQAKAVVHMISQDDEMLLAEHDRNKRLSRGVFLPHYEDIGFPVLDDSQHLTASRRWAPEVLPALVGLDRDSSELVRVEGWRRAEWEATVAELVSILSAPEPSIVWANYAEKLEGCGSKHGFLEPAGNLQSRSVTVGDEDDLFEFMSDFGFTDGLPVVPPTPERVARMLKGTFRDPMEIIAKVPPMMGDATVEKIAINAVMAGAKPEYMPVILAALEAICTDDFNCHGVWATTMSAVPVMIVNGPIREQIGLRAGRNALGGGLENRANLTIGRAVRLLVQNVGGAKPGFSEMATMGSAMKMLATTFGEWEEYAKGWVPLHVERGFKAEDSVVTCISLTSSQLIMDQTSDYIIEHTAVPLSDLMNSEDMGGSGFVKVPEKIAAAIAAGTDQKMPKFTPVNGKGHHGLSIVVAGGEAGKFSLFFSGWTAGPMGSFPTSERIEV